MSDQSVSAEQSFVREKTAEHFLAAIHAAFAHSQATRAEIAAAAEMSVEEMMAMLANMPRMNLKTVATLLWAAGFELSDMKLARMTAPNAESHSESALSPSEDTSDG